MSGAERTGERESEKNEQSGARSGRSRSGERAESAAHGRCLLSSVQSVPCTVCSLQFTSVIVRKARLPNANNTKFYHY